MTNPRKYELAPRVFTLVFPPATHPSLSRKSQDYGAAGKLPITKGPRTSSFGATRRLSSQTTSVFGQSHGFLPSLQTKPGACVGLLIAGLVVFSLHAENFVE
jgi:hypothetical protein